MEEEIKKVMIIAGNDGTPNYSAMGYRQMCLYDLEKYDKLIIKTNKAYQLCADQLVLLLKMCGFIETKNSKQIEKTSRYLCKKCQTVHKDKTAKCTNCGNEDIKVSVMDSFIYELQKITSLTAYQEQVLMEYSKDDTLSFVLKSVQNCKDNQMISDILLLKRWS